MSEQLKYIVEQLNKEPFKRNYNLISFDSLEALHLLQVLNDVLAEVNPQQKLDIREEGADQTALRMLNELKILKYKPTEDPSTFRQGLVSANKPVIYPILVWLFQKTPELKKRAYLGRYLVKVDIPPDILQDEQVGDTFAQYEELVETFKILHKESENLKTSGFSASDIRKDIDHMMEEKQQVSKRIERLKKRVETVPKHEQMLEVARNYRNEQEQQQTRMQQKQDQRNQLHHAEQKLQRITKQVQDLKQSTVGATAEGLVKKLEEENEVNKYLCEEKIPKEIEAMTAACRNLENVMSVPAMGQSELDEIHDKINNLNSEVNDLIEKRMMRNDPIDDKLSLFRQQAVIIAGKKETAAEALKEAKDELQQCQQELQEKREAAKNVGSEQILKGDDFKAFVNKLRGKSSTYKKKRQELAELRSEYGVLTRTEEILRQRDEAIQEQLSMLEAKKGVSGYHDTQEELEKVSAIKSELDDMKGKTLDDMSGMVMKLNASIANKKTSLAPIIKELRPLREKAKEMQTDYDDKKMTYDTMSAGLESNRSKLEQEVRVLQEECSQEESRFHYLNSMLKMIEVQQQRVADEMKAYTSSDPAERKKSYREMYGRKIQEQENLGKSLREKQKAVKASHGPSMKQMKMWQDFESLMECKKRCFLSADQHEESGQIFRSEVDGEDRLVL
ncbi:putative intraflagellar transport protein [Apostichopus japonicus]|uniref:Intraflagellar transport protein 81 homolog n=2 Tax=Stichopus japonicus TaxID=307972 RepID=A0A2G8JQ43_STIJA|nr:putative intraflagellar transport protein [Apostichopus japonicus]